MPEIITFISTPDWISPALSSGATHLVLEDAKVCVRSYSDVSGKLIELASEAKIQNPSVILSANCDMLMHEPHIPMIKQFLETLATINVLNLRVQDVGVAVLAKEINPRFNITLQSETGNHNLESIRFHTRLFNRQVLNNELPLSVCQNITQTIPTQFEIQVHGPILIQYSYRRYLGSVEKKLTQNSQWTLETTPTLSNLVVQDETYPGRYFPVLDNPHGHMMFLYMDRCLFHHLEAVKALNLAGWIVDARGQNLDYLTTALQTFSGTQNSFETLQKACPRPLKAGFFVANKTDQDRESETLDAVGIVLDCINEKCMTVEILDSFDPKTPLTLETPEGKQTQLTHVAFTDLDKNPVTTLSRHQLVMMPWVKRTVPESILKV